MPLKAHRQESRAESNSAVRSESSRVPALTGSLGHRRLKVRRLKVRRLSVRRLAARHSKIRYEAGPRCVSLSALSSQRGWQVWHRDPRLVAGLRRKRYPAK